MSEQFKTIDGLLNSYLKIGGTRAPRINSLPAGTMSVTDYTGQTPVSLGIGDGVADGDAVTMKQLNASGGALVADRAKASALVALPANVYAVTGKECNIYFDNLMIDTASRYDVICSSALGLQQNERWTAVPATTGTYPVAINVHQGFDQNPIASGTTNVVVSDFAVAGMGLSKVGLFIGDSLTAGMVPTGYMTGAFAYDVMGMSLIGTQGNSPNLHEGYPGKTLAWVCTNASSPFVFSGVFNFASYMSAHSYATVDFVCINLGTNDIALPADNLALGTDAFIDNVFSTALLQLNGMIASIKAFNPNVTIGIACNIPPSASQDAFGASGIVVSRMLRKRQHVRWVQKLISAFAGQQAQNIYLVPINVNLDTVNNMQFASSALANSRSTVSLVRQNNSVHPATCGYGQMADSFYAFLKSVWSGGLTNAIPLANRGFVGWTTNVAGSTVTVTQGQVDPWGGTTATRIQSTGGTSNTVMSLVINGLANPHHWSLAILAKNNLDPTTNQSMFACSSVYPPHISSTSWTALTYSFATTRATATETVQIAVATIGGTIDITVVNPVLVITTP